MAARMSCYFSFTLFGFLSCLFLLRGAFAGEYVSTMFLYLYIYSFG